MPSSLPQRDAPRKSSPCVRGSAWKKFAGKSALPYSNKKAKENANNSPWKNRVEIIKCDIRKFYTNDKYDLIVSNPPFFENNRTAEHNGTPNTDTNAYRIAGICLKATYRTRLTGCNIAGTSNREVHLPCVGKGHKVSTSYRRTNDSRQAT